MSRKAGMYIGGGIVFGVVVGVVRHFYKKNKAAKQTAVETLPQPTSTQAVEEDYELIDVEFTKEATIDGVAETMEYVTNLMLQAEGANDICVETPRMELLGMFSIELEKKDKETSQKFSEATGVFLTELGELGVTARTLTSICLARCLDRYRKIGEEESDEVDEMFEELVQIRGTLCGLLEHWFGGRESKGYKAYETMDDVMASHGTIIKDVTNEQADRFYEEETLKAGMH